MLHSVRTLYISAIASVVLMASVLVDVAPILAGAGHNHGSEFETGGDAGGPKAVKINPDIAERMGIKVQSLQPRGIGVGIKATGQIETQPNRQANVTIPTPGKVVELLAKPGDLVKKGQPVAVIASLELLQLRVESLDRRTDAEVSLKEAQANLRLAQEDLARERQIAATDVAQAKTQLAEAQERYNGDAQLASVGALPRRQMLTSKTQLSEAKSLLDKSKSRQAVLRAEAELKRASAAVEGAKSRIELSSTIYDARLSQLRTPSNMKGLVVVQSPISGTISKREVTLGDSFEDAGGQLMTIVNDGEVWATANVYEKDLDQLSVGQIVRIKVASLPGEIFNGEVAQIDPVVAGKTRVLPVRARVSNTRNKLKPGLFAELEIMTGRSPTSVIAVPTGAIAEVNEKSFVYVENGQGTYQPVDVFLGKAFGGWVEVKRGLFAGDRVVTQGPMLLYAQSLQGGTQDSEEEHDDEDEDGDETKSAQPLFSLLSAGNLPWWVVLPSVGTVAAGAFLAGRRGRRSSEDAASEFVQIPEENGQLIVGDDSITWVDVTQDSRSPDQALEQPATVVDETSTSQQ